MLILISWLYQKPDDLDLHSFQIGSALFVYAFWADNLNANSVQNLEHLLYDVYEVNGIISTIISTSKVPLSFSALFRKMPTVLATYRNFNYSIFSLFALNP